MRNGWRYFLAKYLVWLEINLDHQMLVLEFFAIYRVVYSKTGVLAFMVSAKL